MKMININLLPWREELEEERKKEFLFLIGVAAAMAASIILFIHIIISRQIQFQNDDNTYLKNEIKILEKQIAEIKAIDKEKKQLLEKMKVIQSLQASRPEVVKLFDGIVRLIPEGLYLTNLSRTADVVRIDGKAESNTRVSTLMRNIENSNLLKDPKLSVIQVDESKQDQKTVRVPDRLIGFNLQAIEVKASLEAEVPKNVQQ